MASRESDVHDRIRQLRQCGRHWGEDVNLGADSSRVGPDAWYETAVLGTVGLNGNNPGEGPGVIIRDIEHKDIDMLWTAGLIGCMGLAITGRDAEGRLDVFFSHARQYDKTTATTDAANPIHLAKEFVDSHDGVRVFWGTDFFVGHDVSTAQVNRHKAQQKLSNDLGCWVRESDCVPASELVFLPKLGLLKQGKPAEVQAELATDPDLAHKVEFSNSKRLSKFMPDPDISGRIELQLAELRMQRNARLRLYHQDGLRDNKIFVLQKVLDAYQVGNIDVLRHYAIHAKEKTSPFADPSGVNVWHAKEESKTAQLVQEAFADAHTKTYAMGEKGCGLKSDGSNIHNFKEFKELDEERGLRL
ncbi:Uncharacterised protein [Legionella beliardensis]|uniref:Uncharacterized protein n=1 Tax=Legionella beliardensis TaxID=91822 RepID=A0A378HZB3_9GAMM|nr:hypothetical protein [Legionella beliardensis]STX28278.1 Uncharacterised protein [Legionella beliardensis]